LAHRVVFVTGGVFTPKARQYLAGVDIPCVEKPFDIPTLRRTVAELVAWSRSEPEAAANEER
jgi:hypothetical protein